MVANSMSSLWHIISWADGCTPGSLCALLPALTHPCWYTSTTSGTLVVEVLKGFTVILFQDPRYLSSSALLLRVNHMWSVFICYMVSLNGWVVGGWGGSTLCIMVPSMYPNASVFCQVEIWREDWIHFRPHRCRMTLVVVFMTHPHEYYQIS